MADGIREYYDMATISKAAIQWMEDQAEEKESLIVELEEELELALEENANLRLEITRIMTDRSLAV